MAALSSSNPPDHAGTNVENERANVFIGVRAMKHPASFKDLSPLIDPDEIDPSNIPKTIVYMGDVEQITHCVINLYDWLHASLQDRGLIMPVHDCMPARYCSDAIAKFASGQVRILVCAESAELAGQAIIVCTLFYKLMQAGCLGGYSGY